MIRKMVTLYSIGLSATVLAATSTIAADFATKDEAVAMVKRAVAFIREQGEAKAYAEFSRKGGLFHDRDLYIAVLGLDGKVLAHGQRVDFVGQNLIDAKDPDGKLFIKERSELALKHASFWQNYLFMNPATQKVEAKDMYCERLGEANVCGGVYGSWWSSTPILIKCSLEDARLSAQASSAAALDMLSERHPEERRPLISGGNGIGSMHHLLVRAADRIPL